nr:phage tail sheath C-terminal domain-containing protein [Escherichia coli]
MKLILPFPPSVNTYWRHPNKGAFAGKSLISAAGRKFQSAACAAIVEQLRRLPKPTSAPASVEIVLFPPDNRLCTSHSQWRFEPVRRTADVIEDSIQEAMLPYVDRPLDRDVADDILGSINAYMRQLKNLGAIHGGSAWLNDELNTAETLAAGQLYIDYDFGPKSPLERLTLRAMINNKLALEELTV